MREKETNFSNRFHPEDDINGIGDMMINLNINEKVPIGQNQNNFVNF